MDKERAPSLPKNVLDALEVVDKLGLTDDERRILSEEIGAEISDRRRTREGTNKKRA